MISKFVRSTQLCIAYRVDVHGDGAEVLFGVALEASKLDVDGGASDAVGLLLGQPQDVVHGGVQHRVKSQRAAVREHLAN